MGELCAEELVVQVGLAIWRGMGSDGGHRGAMPIGGGPRFGAGPWSGL